jgi:hypothetical protein
MRAPGRLRPMQWKLENCPPLPLWAVHAIAAIGAPVHCYETECAQECDEDDEHNHDLIFLSCFFSIQFYIIDV